MRNARVAGLHFARSEFPSTMATRQEGASFDLGWEFRSNLRLRLDESAMAAKRAKLKTAEVEDVSDERLAR